MRVSSPKPEKRKAANREQRTAMYGVPADLDLSFLHGAELLQVCLGTHQIQFRFHPVGEIAVEGKWELIDSSGQRIDWAHDSRVDPHTGCMNFSAIKSCRPKPLRRFRSP